MKLKDILDKVENKELVLPDFQREYVWVSEDKVKGFIASILCQIPVGNIITFKQKAKTFAKKEMGFNKILNIDPETEVFFLLDGQQRVTTLALYFSDIIFNKIDSINYRVQDLSSSDMRRRFYIEMPDVSTMDFTSENDIFGLLNFNFNEDPSHVSFCTDYFDEIIKEEVFNNKNKDDWFYPKDLKNFGAIEKAKYCTEAVKARKIPLYLLYDNKQLLNKLIREFRDTRLHNIFSVCSIENIDFVKKYVSEHPCLTIDESLEDQDYYALFKANLTELASDWSDKMISYFDNCIDLRLNELKVQDEGPARAINIYEALNTGGALLTTFDLIIAKAANEPNTYGPDKTFYQWIKNSVETHYNRSLLNYLVGNELATWSAGDCVGGITNQRITKVFIKQYLNLLCIISNFTDENGKPVNDISKLDSKYCKEKAQLSLSPKNIWKYSLISMDCICDAFMLMQTKFGIINSSDCGYELMILVIAYSLFLLRSMNENENYSVASMKEVVDKIEAWYWYSLFSGEYSSDQSTRVIKHIQWMHNWIIKKERPSVFMVDNLSDNLDQILNVTKYNSFDVLFMNPDFPPKTTVCNALIQYILSTKPYDFIKDADGNDVSIKSYDKTIKYEIHHMIPLGSATVKLRDSTKTIRSDKKHKLNSPLNLAYISASANKDISSKSISEYQSELSTGFLANYKFDNRIKSYNYMNDNANKDGLKDILESRYELIKGDIQNKIRNLVNLY